MPELIAHTPTRDYPIVIRNGSLKQLGSIIAAYCKGRTAVLITDEQVAALYLSEASQSLEAAGFSVHCVVLPAGEATKSWDQLNDLYGQFHQAGLTRIDPVVALGGGVIGDLAGFAAATWLRGVPLVQVPTSLLAQVDASIGGKTAVDSVYGKNLIGTFYQPVAVIMDPSVLHSLPRRRMAEGMAEVIKYALIGDLDLLKMIEQQILDLEWILERCVSIKTGIVSRDEKDVGERMLLNFGHTIGHALEKATGFSRYTHGEAVAIGMVMAAAIGEQLGETEKGTRERIEHILHRYQLPTRIDRSAEGIPEAIYSDKKRLGSKVHLVLLRKVGQAFTRPITPDELTKIIKEVWPGD
jgi:3-dehydroquinate synthase